MQEAGVFSLDPLTPAYKKGNFNIDDMVRHIGIFTNYLSDNVDEYGANLDSVFISGGSAGGHLTCAVALAIASGDYTDIFSANLTIKGLVPFYPANDLMNFFGISGSDVFKNPEMSGIRNEGCLAVRQFLCHVMSHPTDSVVSLSLPEVNLHCDLL